MPDDVPPEEEAGAPLEVRSPLAGVVRALQSVPDPVFAQAMVGPGIAVEPVAAATGGDPWGEPIAVHAPISGSVATMLPHACAIETPSGRSVLVHLGIDTVELKGAGFSAEVAVGAHVTAGQQIMTWEPAQAALHGFSLVSPVIAVQADESALELVASTDEIVEAGQLLLRWR